jgi:tRNA pseudouridine65 synthase
MPFSLPLLYQDDRIVVIDKPRGYHVHRPEANGHKVPRSKIILPLLRDQIGKKLFPVHRLDAGTSGVLLFALDSEAARLLQNQFSRKTAEGVRKKYAAVVRGFFKDPEGKIDLPLELDSSGELVECLTHYRVLRQVELPYRVGSQYETSRYTWLEVEPVTGRFHQIRRHMNRVAHPVIGDATHGDSRHNSFFREILQIRGLCLRAMSLSLELPWLPEGERRKIFAAGPTPQWQKLEELFEKANSVRFCN